MLSEMTIRRAIGASVPFNFLAAIAFAFPQSFAGRLLDLSDAPDVHAFLLGFIILLFGLMYFWIAMQPTINRPLLTFGGMSKVGVFLVGMILFGFGSVSLMLILGLAGDLAFGSLWLGWLATTRSRK